MGWEGELKVAVYSIPPPLSPPQRPLCIVGRLGRKKKRARGAR